MPAGLCDNCGEEPAKWLMHDTDTGDVRGLGLECLQLIGLGMVAAQGPEAQDSVFATIGYQPTAATKRARKEAAEPEIDPERVIAEIVETGPRDDESESTSEQVDMATQPQADESTNAHLVEVANPTNVAEPLAPTGPLHAAGEADDDPPPY